MAVSRKRRFAFRRLGEVSTSREQLGQTHSSLLADLAERVFEIDLRLGGDCGHFFVPFMRLILSIVGIERGFASQGFAGCVLRCSNATKHPTWR